uniref:Alpha/beta-hydrolase n=1 Tax=Psilocybe cubensis TaxID=181762 RepID=A0A8H7XKG4_PSICU
MSSVYFPAHVVVLFKRLVNVVSTLSISNQYVLYTQAKAKADSSETPRTTTTIRDGLNAVRNDPSRSLNYFKDVEWTRWMHRSLWNRSLLAAGWSRGADTDVSESRNEVNTETLLKATIELPSWIPGSLSWPNLFSFHRQEPSAPQHDDEPPPSNSRKHTSNNSDKKSHRKSPASYNSESTEFKIPPSPPDTIHRLLIHPALFDPIRAPRYPIVLCHGLYGFDSRGPSSFPSMRMHYWSNVLNILRGKVGAEVIVTSVPGTGFISSRASALDEQLRLRARGRGINFLAHSMGGLDCRHLITHIQPREYVPLSLTTISTPHRGSPFMDWCANNIGLGKLRQQEKEMMQSLRNSTRRDIEEFSSGIAEETESSSKAKAGPKTKSESAFTLSLSSLPSSFTTLLLSIVDSPAYANLTSNYLNDVFNPRTPDDPSVKYWSVAGRMSADSVSVWHPFWLPKMVLDGVEEKERERLKREWDDLVHTHGQTKGKGTPLWANEREWGNDGLVTVQSAKWGEFLGIMEGCDHWEMRGARGIELGVDLPAIPAIGLGSFPLPSSFGNRSPYTNPTAQGDGWGFGDWTRFVGAWKKSSSNENGDRSSTSDKSTGPSASKPKGETNAEKRTRERLADDHVVKSSTDTLSAVFDWLIDKVPASTQILGGGSGSSASSATVGDTTKVSDAGSNMKQEENIAARKEKEAEIAVRMASDKELSDSAVKHTVGMSSSPTSSSAMSGASSGTRTQEQTSPSSEMKKRMSEEDKGRRKRELSSKQDLERFYVALARKMYDEGL